MWAVEGFAAAGHAPAGRPRQPGRDTTRSSGPKYPGFGALFLIWTAVGAVTSARHYFGPAPWPDSQDLAWFVACIAYFYPWVGLTPLAFRLERRFPLGTGGWARHFGWLAICSVPVSLLAAPLMLVITWPILVAFGVPVNPPRNPLHLFRYLLVAQVDFWASVAGGYVVRTQFELREQERKAARLALEKSQLEAGLNQAQLEVLRARLNPHFLFNSLQNISVMTKEDPQVASQMLTRLGDLLRMVLRQDSQPETTLREEIALTQSYVALEQMRFGDRLKVGFEIDPDVQEALVPCFLLQPLIENAVIHGLRGVRKNGVIKVSAVAEEGILVLTVTDNGIGPPEQAGAEFKVGVGLGSTCERLARMYPERHTFSIGRPPQGGAEVRITVPLRSADGEDRPYQDEQPALANR